MIWPFVQRHPWRALILLSVAAGVFLLLLLASIVAVRGLRNTGNGIKTTPNSPDQFTNSIAPVLAVSPPLAGLGWLTWDTTRRYVFPIAADPALFTWTHTHWDGTYPVAIEARLALTRSEFEAVTRAQVVAVTAGFLRGYDGPAGGFGYLLEGDDGLDYYYAHLSEKLAPAERRVFAGQVLGAMGNTGSTAQYVEPQLQLAVGTRGSLWLNDPDIDAAEWLHTTFGLAWAERTTADVAVSWPSGWPVQNPRCVIETTYFQSLPSGLPEPALQFGFIPPAPDVPQDVHATLAGVVNVIRWTERYGTRIQITNPASRSTVIISGLATWFVTDGQVIDKHHVIGQWNLAEHPHLHYMIFQNGVNIDPEPTLR